MAKQKKYEKKYNSLDNRFIFLNSGFNVRPTEIQAGLAMNQFKRLEKIKKIKKFNHKAIIANLKKDKNWQKQYEKLSIEVADGSLNPFEASEKLVRALKGKV